MKWEVWSVNEVVLGSVGMYVCMYVIHSLIRNFYLPTYLYD